MDFQLWNPTSYYGDLKNYSFPCDKEFSDLLLFLRGIKSNKKCHLTDVNYWDMKYPPTGYDIYIICAFGEFVNEDFLNKIEQDTYFEDKLVVLITSQYWETNKFNLIKVFHLEHLQTITRFFDPTESKNIIERSHCHGILSRRTAIHKSYTLVNLLDRFLKDVQYTFCNAPEQEYSLQTLNQDLNLYYPGLDLTDNQLNILTYLHDNPTMVDGHQWSIDNYVYAESQLIWTPESIFLSRENAPTAYLTEKTFKAIVSRSPFIIIGQKHSYARLTSLGFMDYTDEFNIQFDDLSDLDRFAGLIELMDTFDFSSFLTSSKAQEIADYNYHYFFNNFVTYVNKQNEKKIEQILEFINDQT